jgi:transposase
VVGRGELTDRAWAELEPLLPANGRRGGQWRDHRRVINGILWKLRTGAPWRDLPERYRPWKICHDRLVRWRRDGTWDLLLAMRRPSPKRSGNWSGSSVSIRPACVPISTPPAPADSQLAQMQQLMGEGDRARPGRGARPVPGWADHQNPPGLRRPRPALERGPHPRAAPRQHPASSRLGRYPRPPARQTRSTPQAPRASRCRSRLQLPNVPAAAPPSRHPPHHPRAVRSTPTPSRQARSPTGV